MPSRFLVALISTGTLALKIVGNLVALKLRSTGMSTPTVDRICCYLSYSRQECQLPLLTGLVAPKSYVVNSDS